MIQNRKERDSPRLNTKTDGGNTCCSCQRWEKVKRTFLHDLENIVNFADDVSENLAHLIRVIIRDQILM
jgi:hypothetical protein